MQNLIPTPVQLCCATKHPVTLHSILPKKKREKHPPFFNTWFLHLCRSHLSVICKTELGSYFSHGFTKEQLEMALVKAKAIVNSNPVVVFSKTYCGYCKRVKKLLTLFGARYKVVELDEEADGGELQEALGEWTGHRTVPNVFIGGKHIGGCDAVLEKHQSGQLLLLLREAGAVASNPVSA